MQQTETQQDEADQFLLNNPEQFFTPTFQDTKWGVLEWFSDRRILNNTTLVAQAKKLGEEAGEVYGAIEEMDKGEIIKELGDCMVVITGLAEMIGISPEECYASAFDKIKDRKGLMRTDGQWVKYEDLTEEEQKLIA